MTLPDRLRYARKKRGWTQRQLAERAGMSNAYVSILERTGTPSALWESPKVATIEKLAKALRVPVAWLAFGQGREPAWPEPRTRGAA